MRLHSLQTLVFIFLLINYFAVGGKNTPFSTDLTSVKIWRAESSQAIPKYCMKAT